MVRISRSNEMMKGMFLRKRIGHYVAVSRRKEESSDFFFEAADSSDTETILFNDRIELESPEKVFEMHR
jgi:hypothetical protein